MTAASPGFDPQAAIMLPSGDQWGHSVAVLGPGITR